MFKRAFTAQIFWSVVYVGITVIGKLATPGARLDFYKEILTVLKGNHTLGS